MASLPSPRISLSRSSSKNYNHNRKFQSRTTRLLSSPFYPTTLNRRLYHQDAYLLNSTSCRCKNTNSSEDSSGIRWDLLFQDAFRGAVKQCTEYLSAYLNLMSKEVKKDEFDGELKDKESELCVNEVKETDEWNWERWTKYFGETQEAGRLLHALKTQFRRAVAREDYKSAERLKQAILTAKKYDAVGRAIYDLNKAIEDERYNDAAYIRDNAGVGLIGWWAGVSENIPNPHGLIVRITAEYGRYVAKSYTSRQLTSSGPGLPLFEVYFTEKNGEFKQQGVYMKPSSKESGEFTRLPFGKSDIGNLYLSDSFLGGKDELIFDEEEEDEEEEEEEEEKDESDVDILDLSRDNNALPPFSYKILQVFSHGKLDRDQIAKIIDQILESEDASGDQIVDEEDESDDEGDEEDESDEEDEDEEEEEEDEFEISKLEDSESEEEEEDENNLKILGGESEKESKEAVHIPAKLEKKDRYSFTLHVEREEKEKEKEKEREKEISGTQEIKKKKAAVASALKGSDMLMDLSKLANGKRKIAFKIIIPDKDMLSRNRSQQKLSGLTHFRRIMTPVSSDPLSGLYASESAMDSEIVCLQRKFGQWKEDDSEKERELEFYEYVEAVKLTGNQLVPPAGQVMFRAKVGKGHQLPHKGLIPKELGVVARYKGQGRVPDLGSKKTQWVDGELLILDGKFIRNGPVIGFFYWASNYQFFEFFSRLNLPS